MYRLRWLGLTPEPERELPDAVAALRSGGQPPAAMVEAERCRMERLVLRGTQRRWLRYLDEVTALVDEVVDGRRQAEVPAALLVAEVVLDHHRLLIGLPGSGYAATSAQRQRLEQAVRLLRQRQETAR